MIRHCQLPFTFLCLHQVPSNLIHILKLKVATEIITFSVIFRFERRNLLYIKIKTSLSNNVERWQTERTQPPEEVTLRKCLQTLCRTMAFLPAVCNGKTEIDKSALRYGLSAEDNSPNPG